MIPWLAMQQLLDSALPIGGFSHSFGLETMVQEGRIRQLPELEDFVRTMLMQSWATSDGLLIKAVYERKDDEGWERVWQVEKLVHLQRIGMESRTGVEKMGRRLLQLAARIYPDQDWEPLEKAYRSGRALATHPLVHGYACERFGIELQQAVQGYFYTCIVTSVNSALRLMPMGQTDGQAMIARLSSLTEEAWLRTSRMRPEEAYSTAPMAEIMMSRHEQLYSRLFMS